MREWIDYYDSAHSIYVNARHREVHFRTIADHIIAQIPSPEATVLDFSCGEAVDAARVANACRELILVEPAPNLRARLKERFRDETRITVRAPEDLAAMRPASLDLIVMVSVVQYMTPEELEAALTTFRRLLKPDGKLAVADVIPPDAGAAADVVSLLSFGAREGFFLAALTGIARTVLSDYRRLRSQLGLMRYSEHEMRGKLSAAGFASERSTRNMGHNPARMTFVASPSAATVR